MFTLFNMLFIMLAVLLDNLIGTNISGTLYGLFYFIYAIALFLPGLAVSVRRIHDVGKSGWWYLIGFVPIIGIFYLLYLFVKPGDEGENEYGPDPKSEMIDSFE